MKTVLITGASRGIGMATAVALGRAGFQVAATMRDPSRSQELARIVERERLPIRTWSMDVDQDDSVSKTIASIREQSGPIDVLVNNAGIESRGAIEELDISRFRAVMETNYFGPLRGIKAVLPSMRERRTGCIINITSVAGKLASAPFAPYTASKFALEALSEVLAQEVKSFNIRVAIVEPGIIDTAMARAATVAPRSSYPHAQRMADMFGASMERNSTPPELVAQKIAGIIQSDDWKLRHPVGPDAEPFLQLRASMSDEQWVDWPNQ
jgi:NAD(P)-dependent dehydrogenase (short-subunit alcohol dehydrogenase family)